MRDKDVIQHIQDLCRERSWTYYRLAKEADIPYSTLNNMVNRTNIPTIPTLQKLCDAYHADAEGPVPFRHHTCRFLSRRAGCPAAYRRTAGNHYALQ